MTKIKPVTNREAMSATAHGDAGQSTAGSQALAPQATALISRAALRHNLQRLRSLAPQSRIIAVVKANAYGHGIIPVAQALANSADAFAVARLSEALQLRASGLQQPVLLLEGFLSASQLPLIAAQGFHIVLHSPQQLTALEQTPLPCPVRVWLKLDSGMHRLGFAPQEIAPVYQRLSACRQVCPPVNLLSHFARADEGDEGDLCHESVFNGNGAGGVKHRHTTSDISGQASTLAQLTCFRQCLAAAVAHDDAQHQRHQQHRIEGSLAASAGILRYPQAHFDWIRPGIILYGVSPLSHPQTAAASGFKPAMTLSSSLIAVRPHPAHAPVGYGGNWRSPRATRLGVIAVGYGDGYPQQAPCGTPVLINGQRFPVVGRVSMDMMCVDLGANSPHQPGDKVVLWGDALPVEQIALATHTSPYELLARLTPRVSYQYVD